MIEKNKKTEKIFVFVLNIFLLSLAPFLLSSCTPPIKKDDIITNLFPNVWVFVSHLIAFAVLLFVMMIFVLKPTKKFLAKKKSFIDKTLNDAKKTNNEASNNLNIAKQSKIAAIEKANITIKEAQDNAYKIINKAKIDAKEEASKIINKANFYLEHEKKQMEKEYQHNVIETAFNVIENVFSDEKNDKNKQKYIDHILNKIKKDFEKNEK